MIVSHTLRLVLRTPPHTANSAPLVHKESIAVSIAPNNSTEVRRYGIIGGTLDAVDKLIKSLSQPDVELRFVYEAGPCGLSSAVICATKASIAIWSLLR